MKRSKAGAGKKQKSDKMETNKTETAADDDFDSDESTNDQSDFKLFSNSDTKTTQNPKKRIKQNTGSDDESDSDTDLADIISKKFQKSKKNRMDSGGDEDGSDSNEDDSMHSDDENDDRASDLEDASGDDSDGEEEEEEQQDAEEDDDEGDNNDDERDDEDEDDDKPDESNEDSDSEEKFSKLRKELSEMPFEDLHKLEQMIGTKAFKTAMSGGKDSGKKTPDAKKGQGRKKFVRENKNRPMEMTSKKAVKLIRDVEKKKKKAVRDPRFDDLSGEYNETYFNKSYSFLSDIRLREKEKIQKQLKKESDPEKKTQLKNLLQRMSQKEQSDKAKVEKDEREKRRNQQERELVKQGKTPFYLKESEKKKLDLADKYKELSKSGKVDNYLNKKRKKNAAKDRKKLPNMP